MGECTKTLDSSKAGFLIPSPTDILGWMTNYSFWGAVVGPGGSLAAFLASAINARHDTWPVTLSPVETTKMSPGGKRVGRGERR